MAPQNYCPKRRKVVEGREIKEELNFQFSETSAYYQSDEKSKLRHGKGNVERCGVKAAPYQRLYKNWIPGYIGASVDEGLM